MHPFVRLYKKIRGKEIERHTVAPEDRVPLKEKVAFGAGGVARGIQETADNMLMSPVFVLGVGIDPRIMGWCNVLYRLFDGITDPFMGVISDNTRTRWGRRRPYIVLGTILMAISMPLVFSFGQNWSTTAITFWMIGAFLFIYLAQTIFNVPYQAMLLESSPDSHERTNMAAYVAVFGFFVQLVMGWSWYLAQLDFFKVETDPVPIVHGAFWVISGFSLLVLLLGFLPAIFMKERYYANAAKQKQLGVIQNFRLTFRSKPFLILISFVLLFIVGFNVKWGLVFFVRYYYVCGGNEELASRLTGLESTIQAFAAVAGVVFFTWFSHRIGKIWTIRIVVSLMFLTGVALYWLYTPAYPYLSIVPGILFGPAMSAMWVMIPSMTGDIVDDDELRTGERREGAFASIFSWVTKLALSTASGLSGYLSVWAGYRPELRENLPDAVIQNMRWMLVAVPSTIVFIALVLLFLYPINEKVIAANRARLEAVRGKV
jgi:GPH family glycoside/pentoside/hexuronide:cation symporter